MTLKFKLFEKWRTIRPHNKIVIVIVIFFIVLCVMPLGSQGPYKGRVVDAVTKEPLSGVPVVGQWVRYYPAPVQFIEVCSDAKELVTDHNGEFEFSKQREGLLSNKSEIDVVIFKAGYLPFASSWSLIDYPIFPGAEPKVHWEDERAIIPLKKLPIGEAVGHAKPGFPFPIRCVPKSGMPQYFEEEAKWEKMVHPF